MNPLYLIIAVVIGYLIGRQNIRKQNNSPFSKKSFAALDEDELKNISAEARKALAERTEARKEKILEYLTKELAHQQALANCNIEDRKKGITREEVEKLLKVSDTTALKYLDELETDQKITQSAPAGRTVYYTLPS